MPSYFPTLNFPIYSGWTRYTPCIPKIYWNVYSQEQRLKHLFMEYDRMVHYLDYISDSLNEYTEEIAEEVNRELEKSHNELIALREELIQLVKEIGEGSLTWNCQHGYYDSSVSAMRDMFNDVTVHSMTIESLNKLDGLTVESLANCGLNVKGFAVLNYWLIDEFPILDEYKYIEHEGGERLTVSDINRGIVTDEGYVMIP